MEGAMLNNKVIKKTSMSILTIPMVLSASIMDLQNLYDQKNYVVLLEEVKKDTSLYSQVQLHLLWAKSAEALGKTEEAISAYERVLMIRPDVQEARLALARLYSNSGRMVLTKQLAEDTEDYQLSVDERTNINALLIEDDQLLTVSANIGVGYDSNINVSPGDLDLPSSGEEISSKFIKLQAAFSSTYQFENNENVYLRGSAAFSYQNNEESYYNLFAGEAIAGLGYMNKSYDLFVPVHYGRLHYLENDLLESVGVKPRVNIALTSSLIGNVNARYEKRNYFQEVDKYRDDSVLGAGAGLYWLLSDSVSYVKVNYNDYDAKYKDMIPFVGKSAIELSTGIDYDIDSKYTGGAKLFYRATSYDDPIAQNEDKRSDDFYKADLKLSRDIFKDIVGSVSYSYSFNDSNYAPSEYRKHIIMCNVNYKY
jgi:tetratricopeptide (TPR) repeat protein